MLKCFADFGMRMDGRPYPSSVSVAFDTNSVGVAYGLRGLYKSCTLVRLHARGSMIRKDQIPKLFLRHIRIRV